MSSRELEKALAEVTRLHSALMSMKDPTKDQAAAKRGVMILRNIIGAWQVDFGMVDDAQES